MFFKLIYYFPPKMWLYLNWKLKNEQWNLSGEDEDVGTELDSMVDTFIYEFV